MVACECREYGSCHYPVAKGESQVAQLRRMKDTSVKIKRLFGCEVARNHGVGAQRHHDGGHGFIEESGQRYGCVRNPSALSPDYQGDNL